MAEPTVLAVTKETTKLQKTKKPSRKHLDNPGLPLRKYTQFLVIDVYAVRLTEAVKDATIGALAELQNDFSNIEGVTDITGWASIPITLLADTAGIISLLQEGTNKDKKIGFDGELADYSLDKHLDRIYLPLPNNIRDSHSQKYDETTFNMEEMMMRSSLGVARSAMSTVMPDTANTMTSVLTLAEHLAKRGNITIDPNPLMTYAGSMPRNYTFDFLLYPTNAEEAEYYREAVEWLQYYSIIERTENNLFGELGMRTLSVKTCFTFNAQKIVNKVAEPLTFINTIMNCDKKDKDGTSGFFLANSNLVLGGADALQLYNDGSPKSGSLTLSFIERKPLWRKHWVAALDRMK